MPGGSYYLSKAWEHFFRPNLPTLGAELLEVLESIMAEAHRLTVALGQANPHSNPLIFTRSIIEANEANADNNDFGVIITWLC